MTPFIRIPLDYVLDINAYDVNNADALVHQTEKIQEHGSQHAHQISHVRTQKALYTLVTNLSYLYRISKQYVFNLINNSILL